MCCKVGVRGVGYACDDGRQKTDEDDRRGILRMAEQGGNKDARHQTQDTRPQKSRDGGKASVSKAVSDFVDGLSDEHRMLVVLKAQLYGGTWEPMLDDLRNRLAGEPYIFKLVNRIEDDIARIEQMLQFETEHNIDLADYVELP